MKITIFKGSALCTPAIIALAIALMFVIGCKEEKPKTEGAELKCGGEEFDPKKQFCFKDKAYDKCGCEAETGEEYNPETHFCSTREICAEVAELCGGKPYDYESEYCCKEKIHEKCAIYNDPDAQNQVEYIDCGC